jgi:hypothetical protein
MRVVLDPTVEVVVMEGVVAVGAGVIVPRVVLFEAALGPADEELPVGALPPVEVTFFFDDRLPPTPPPIAAPVMMKITIATRM